MMDTTNPTNTTSPVRGAMTYFMGSLAVLTCPCHLPILLLLLSGTAAGAFLSENIGLAAVMLLPVFLLSAIVTWRLLDRTKTVAGSGFGGTRSNLEKKEQVGQRAARASTLIGNSDGGRQT